MNKLKSLIIIFLLLFLSGIGHAEFVIAGGGSSVDLTAPGPIGSVTPSTGAFTDLSVTGTLGVNVVTNGTFTINLTGWTGTNWAWSAGTALHTAGNTSALTQAAATVTVGTLYELSFDVAGQTAGTLTPAFGGCTGYAIGASATNIQLYCMASATTAVTFTPSNGFDGAIDNVVLSTMGVTTIKDSAITSPVGEPILFKKTLSNVSRNNVAMRLDYQTNIASGTPNDTGLVINQVDTASPGTSNLLDTQVAGASKFKVDNAGTVTLGNSGIILNPSVPSLVASGLSIQGGTGTNLLTFTASGNLIQTTGTTQAFKFNIFYNQTSGTAANTDLLINRTETAVGSGVQYFLDLQTASGSAYAITNKGHHIVDDAITGSYPALTSCGNSPTLAAGSNDHAGIFTIGATGTGCAITFGTPYTNEPSCKVVAEVSANLTSYSKTNAVITVVGLPGKFNYDCKGLNGGI